MKKPLQNLLLLSLIGLSIPVAAQPTITAAGYTPIIGTSIVNATNGGGFSPGAAGASQTWDLSAIGSTGNQTTSFVANSSTMSGASFPTSNLAAQINFTEVFYKTTASSLQLVGLSMGGTKFIYSDPEDYLRFPFTMGSTYTDHFVCNYEAGANYTREGNSTVTADGYGTVITPNGTYTNVLRVHITQQYHDSTFSSPLVQFNVDNYWWIKDGIKTPLAYLYSISSGGITSTNGGYVTGSVGLADQSKVFNSIELYPVPAKNELNVALNSDVYQKAQFKISNYIGQVVNVQKNYAIQAGNNLFNIDIAELSEGVYLLQIILDNGSVETKKFTII